MTEKRYKVIGYINGCKMFAVFDNVSDYSIAYFDNHIEAEQLCGKLNELYDENQYLKQQNIMLRLNVEKLGDDVKYLRGLKKDNLGSEIEFMDFKIRLIEQLIQAKDWETLTNINEHMDDEYVEEDIGWYMGRRLKK